MIMAAQPNPAIDAAVAEMQLLIRSSYPEATFAVAPGEDPEGVYLIVTVDVEDTDPVFDLVVNRLLELQVEAAIPLFVLPIRPLARIMAPAHDRELAARRPAVALG
jgi:hypothetical protein